MGFVLEILMGRVEGTLGVRVVDGEGDGGRELGRGVIRYVDGG